MAFQTMSSLPVLLFITFTVWVLQSKETVATSDDNRASGDGKKFILMLFDGFRWDYFGNFSDLPNFNRFRSEGVHADYVRPNFPSLSYPGYYTILTGRYAESHGFIENTMYDKHHDMFFWTDTDVNGSMSFWWNYTDPLWVTAVKSGLKTYVYHWPGCHVEINGVLPTYYEKYDRYNDTEELKDNINSVLDKFSRNEADVGIIYSEYTDMVGHRFGPESNEMGAAVKEIDKAIGLLLDGLDQHELDDKVNVILVSDHGMTDVSSAKKIQLSDVINMDDVEYLIGYGAGVGILPASGKLDNVYEALKKLSDVYVWKAEDIPNELHYKNNYRVPPLIIVPKPSVYIEPLVNNSKQIPPIFKANNYRGNHGYLPSDTKDMGAIFLGLGPDLKSNFSAPPIYMVDIYNLMTHLLQVKALPNNGTWSNVRDMLVSYKAASAATLGTSPTLIGWPWSRFVFIVATILCLFKGSNI